jgi:hypothetical protein
MQTRVVRPKGANTEPEADFISKAAGPPSDISQFIRNLRKLRRCVRANRDLSTDQKVEFLGYIGTMEVSIGLKGPQRG